MIILCKQSRPSTGGDISCNITEAVVDTAKLKGGVD